VGQRRVDGALTEIVWNDEESGLADVRLMNDADIPAQWVAVHANDAALLDTLVGAMVSALPVQDFETLRAAAERPDPGTLSRLALTHDPRLVCELPPMLVRAFESSDARAREDAAMAAHLAALADTAPVLGAALAREEDGGVRAMIAHAMETIASARST
jgi:hypothetical protein